MYRIGIKAGKREYEAIIDAIAEMLIATGECDLPRVGLITAKVEPTYVGHSLIIKWKNEYSFKPTKRFVQKLRGRK